MPKEALSSRLSSKSSQHESNENELGASLNQLHFPPPRTPLNSIPDPSQYQKELQESEVTRTTNRSSDKSKAVLESSASVGLVHGTPRVFSRYHGKVHLEPSSAQSTPARSGGSRVSLGGRGVSSSSFSRVSRGISVVNPDDSIEVPQFELVDDPLFWKDHNVQVLIRIRPLSTIERVSQGYTRCLRQESSQTLVWLGHPETRFTFDHVACETISQEKLFTVAGLPMVENCLSGYNSCMFAYGQTGSGKTYTMMGEINEVEGKLSEDCGVTPRIFEYLFSRIRTEEESRRDERLKFSCKCSFLEIYNEQITDLLESSSNNLQLREDLKKGVYVENLTEYNVTTVNDVVNLLIEGAANRKMAATNMNSESSRSHSVFTCIIESQWEKDSMTHYRFARLNLVDLAGSERQKSSGAEGDRLKEAANINKSLSTLGLVIMSLVDLAHGKHRHVPYRDSRLTFLLQDSLGGNSKTTIIANVSPSNCSANETLSTLKFAQRAKLIQNDAKVNENASGDVTALQRQIQQLKGQLSSLMKHHNLSRSPSSGGARFEESTLRDNFMKYNLSAEGTMVQNEKVKCLKVTLLGALRREKMAETTVQKLEAEIEHTNRLAGQREEDAQRTKLMLKFREEKIKQLEYLVNGSVSTEKYLMEENKALKEEIQLLQARIDRNPELTRFALENIRLLEQLQLFQNFYELGERETILAEVGELRDQLLDITEGKDEISSRYDNKVQDNDTVKELEDCRNMNSRLMREVDELRTELRKYLNCGQATLNSVADSFSKDPEELRQIDKYSLVETISIRSDSGDELASYTQADDAAIQNKMEQNMISASVLHPSDAEKELMEARMLIEALECEQVDLFRELQLLREQNHRYMEILSNKNKAERRSALKVEGYHLEDDIDQQNKGLKMEHSAGIDRTSLPAKLDKLTQDLEAARLLNCQYQEDQASQFSHQHQVDLVCEQVELETARTILHLPEEVAALQLELDKKLYCMSQENTILRNTIAAKDEEVRALCMEWEKATLELTNFLVDGSRSLKDASGQIESIVCSFPQINIGISEKVERLARVCIEKEETILLLQKSLEDAQKMVLEMEEKLTSLKGATIALNEFQQPDKENSEGEVIQLSMLLKEKMNTVEVLESKLKTKDDQIIEAEKRAEATFLVVKWLTDFNKFENQSHILLQIQNELAETNDKLNFIENYINKNSIVHLWSTKNEDLIDVDGWSADCSTSVSDYSTESVASENNMDGSLDAYFTKNDPKTTEETVDLKVQGGSASKFDPNDFAKIKKSLKQPDHGETMTFRLREELEMVFDAFNKLYFRLSQLLNENDVRDYPLMEGLNQVVPSSELTRKINDARCADTSEVVINEKTNHGSSFLSKFEEARETMKEADFMLNALLKANAKGKEFSSMWRQAGEQLMAERASLIDEVEKLKSSMRLKEEENELLLDNIHDNMLEITNSMSLLEGCFQQTQKEMDYRFKELYSDFLLIWKEMRYFVGNSRSSLEDIFSEIMENGFALFVQHMCYVGEFMCRTPNFKLESGFNAFKQQESNSVKDISQQLCLRGQDDVLTTYKRGAEEAGHSELVANFEKKEPCPSDSNLFYENLSLKKELQRNEVVLQGVLFDFSLLQESASNKKDIKDETEELFLALGQLRHELDKKTSQLDDLLLQHKKLETSLTDTENALLVSNSNLELAKETIDTLSDQNADLRVLLKDLYLKKSEAEEQLEEQKEVVKGLEKEILRHTLEDKKLLSSVEGISEDLRKVTSDRDKLREEVESVEEELRKVRSEREELREEVCSLNEKLEMAYAVADESEALAVEARQESEASKIYADQKEEEVKILERSVEELECTINVLEKKVHEMDEEVGRHMLVRDSLELEIQALRQRLSTVENYPDIVDSEKKESEQTEDQMSRQLPDKLSQLHEAHHRIRLLEREREEQNKEIKRCKEYISEVILHSEAQASQYQQKYKTLEAMIREMKRNLSNPASTAPTPAPDKTEKSSMRARGSSSPFRCIASLVQQMNVEKDQELSVAKLRIEELEALAASRHKEVCMLNTRLAAAESMTHDVIRDLLGVKLDITNYANLIDQENVQKLLVAAHQQTEEFLAKEQLILNLRKRIDNLIEERESCASELNRKEADILTAQVTLEQLQERDQLLSAQNEMLKMDKTNLIRRITELDDMVKMLLSAQSTQEQLQQRSKRKEGGVLKLDDTDFTKRLAHSEKILSRVNGELAQYRRASTSRPAHGFEAKYS